MSTTHPVPASADDGLITGPVKLVVWDLDDTLWTGTLSEGPVDLAESRAELIRTLNRRGIVNSICSKNDRDQVRARLESAGLWDEFVFASIDWTPKGARVARIVEDIQLRPPNVLFLDDNQLNRHEVRHAAPGIQTAGPEVIDRLLDSPELAGKDDAGLTRLHQYQVLERKLADRSQVPSSNEDFLRSCDIRVGLFDDAGSEFARLYELVNRTNQLNFTKRRPGEEEFAALLADPSRRTGYVRARDRYGDYGICGFFALSADGRALTDFLFSCRTMNMGVEQWVYGQLGRPALVVVGEVVADPVGEVDWITSDASLSDVIEGTVDGQGRGVTPAGGSTTGRLAVLMVGGCDLMATAEYLGGSIETDFSRAGPTGALVHVEHTDLLRQAAIGLTPEQGAVVDRLPFVDRAVFASPVLRDSYDLLVYSVLMDYTQGRYRHRTTGLVVPWHQHDQVVTDPASWPAVEQKFSAAGIDRDFLQWFTDEFEPLGPLSVDQFQQNIRWLAGAVPPDARVLFLNGAEVPIDNPAEPGRHLRHRQMNLALEQVVAELPNAGVCDIRAVVRSEDDLAGDIRHYRRHVYLGIAELIRSSSASSLRLRRSTGARRLVKRSRRAAGVAKLRVKQQVGRLVGGSGSSTS